MPLSPYWNASWIGPCDHPSGELGVFLYRCSVSIEAVPTACQLRVSADNRYKLFVNGAFVGFGPQRGDEKHWFFETWDVAPFIKAGENFVEALVWNFGRWAPMAQHTVRTGFICEVVGSREGEPEEKPSAGIVTATNTPGDWKIARIDGWTFDMMNSHDKEFYIDVGPGEIIDARTTPSLGIETDGSCSSLQWITPHHIAQGNDRGAGGGGVPWMLIPRSIPPMRYEKRGVPPVIRRGFVDDNSPSSTTDGEALSPALSLPDGSKVLLDFQELLCAYPRLRLQGPEGAQVTLTYAEAPWQDDHSKGNRDVVAGKRMGGYQDKLVLSGGEDLFEPLWWRTFRYVLIEFDAETTTNQEVCLLVVDAIETGYPIKVESSFESDDPCVKPIWDVSVRTAERCAAEHYFDCPYYEQLQYVGDTRIQALIGYYLGRDRALTRNAVETLGWSIMENGLTQSRYPSRQTQVIPPFSLWWVMMLYDQLLYDGGGPEHSPHSNTSRELAAKRVRVAFEELGKREGSYWCFGDWVNEWRWGVPPGDARSTVHQLTRVIADLAYACIEFGATGEQFGVRYRQRRNERLKKLYCPSGGLVRSVNDPEWQPTEHAEALYRIAQMMNGDAPDPWPAEALAEDNAAKCTYYFSFYKHLAMFGRPEEEVGTDWADGEDRTNKSNRSDKTYQSYFDELAPWREMIESGLTTFAETPEPTRSDCHAWSAHPILGFFQIIAGVTSTAPGWSKARIVPHPGDLRRFDARIAHPEGELRVAFEDGRLAIDTPVPATVVWKGKREEIKPGRFEI